MQSFTSDDGLVLRYLDTARLPTSQGEDERKPWLVLIHGFTGTHHVWKRNIPALLQHYRVIAPDLRGHGESDTPKEPFTVENSGVERLARDLRGLIDALSRQDGKGVNEWRGGVVGGSLGCAVIWSYAHLYTPTNFTHAILIDQSPLQNTLPDWQPPYSHKGLQTLSDFQSFAELITTNPTAAHTGTVDSCLGYRSHPTSSPRSIKEEADRYEDDKAFFLGEALKGKSEFYVALMGYHTALDHRANIIKSLGPNSESQTKVLVIASRRSGCFEPEGVLSVVAFVNGGEKEGLARGEAVSWGGHWCYWEDHDTFDKLALNFLNE